MAAVYSGTSGVISITFAAQFTLRSIGPLRRLAAAQASHESLELHQVGHAEERTLSADGKLRIHGREVRPLPRNRADAAIVGPQQQPHPISVVPLPHADELLPAERMERMRYAHKARRGDRRTCILS